MVIMCKNWKKKYIQSQLYEFFSWSRFWTWQARFGWKMCAYIDQKCNSKKSAQSKSLKLSQNVAYSVSFYMKNLMAIEIAVTFWLEALERVYTFSKMARLLRPEVSQAKLWLKIKNNSNNIMWWQCAKAAD